MQRQPHDKEQDTVGFDALIEKVRQAETALEAKERQTTADWRQVKASWRAAWTPGRIVIAGLVSGFLIGRAQPLKHATGGGALQLMSALGSLFAGGSAQAAAGEAEKAADAADTAAGTDTRERRAAAAQTATRAAHPANDPAADVPPYEVPETFRGHGQL